MPADTTDTSVSCAMRFLCIMEFLCPAKACLVLNERLHERHEKALVGFVAGSKAAWLPFGNVTTRANGRSFCRGSIAASESAISEGRFQTNLRWTSLGCQWTAIILRVLLRYLPFHYGGTKGICCQAFVAASESTFSEGRFQKDLHWTSLRCHCTTDILMVLLRYLPLPP